MRGRSLWKEEFMNFQKRKCLKKKCRKLKDIEIYCMMKTRCYSSRAVFNIVISKH